MPTGYTAIIGENCSFAEFVEEIARGFIPQCRDMDGPIPEKFVDNDKYYSKRLKAARQKLRRFNQRAIYHREQFLRQMIGDHNKHIETYEKILEDKKLLYDKYNKMYQRVSGWQHPTDKHIEIRNFMLKQIGESIDFDCDVKFTKEQLTAKKFPTLKEYIKEQRDNIVKDVNYYKEHRQKEKGRLAETNLWLKQLRDSLKS